MNDNINLITENSDETGFALIGLSGVGILPPLFLQNVSG